MKQNKNMTINNLIIGEMERPSEFNVATQITCIDNNLNFFCILIYEDGSIECAK